MARVFLLVGQFGSVTEALAEIRKRGGAVTLGTVSKVCKSLEADLVIERGRGEDPVPRPPGSRQAEKLPQPPRVKPSPFVRRLRLLQPEKLLDLLADNYTPPEVSRTWRGKTALPPEKLRERLARWEEERGAKVVLTGASSADAYAVLAREPMQSFYCSDSGGAIRSLGEDIRATERFANVTLLETRADFVYFDRRPGLVASPIQSYLELLGGDKRERETAGQVRRVILGPPARGSRKG